MHGPPPKKDICKEKVNSISGELVFPWGVRQFLRNYAIVDVSSSKFANIPQSKKLFFLQILNLTRLNETFCVAKCANACAGSFFSSPLPPLCTSSGSLMEPFAADVRGESRPALQFSSTRSFHGFYKKTLHSGITLRQFTVQRYYIWQYSKYFTVSWPAKPLVGQEIMMASAGEKII